MPKLDVKPIPVPLGFNHPDTPGNILPRHEFSMGIIGMVQLTSSKRKWQDNSHC